MGFVGTLDDKGNFTRAERLACVTVEVEQDIPHLEVGVTDTPLSEGAVIDTLKDFTVSDEAYKGLIRFLGKGWYEYLFNVYMHQKLKKYTTAIMRDDNKEVLSAAQWRTLPSDFINSRGGDCTYNLAFDISDDYETYQLSVEMWECVPYFFSKVEYVEYGDFISAYDIKGRLPHIAACKRLDCSKQEAKRLIDDLCERKCHPMGYTPVQQTSWQKAKAEDKHVESWFVTEEVIQKKTNKYNKGAMLIGTHIQRIEVTISREDFSLDTIDSRIVDVICKNAVVPEHKR
jgi:hypothetical protein